MTKLSDANNRTVVCSQRCSVSLQSSTEHLCDTCLYHIAACSECSASPITHCTLASAAAATLIVAVVLDQELAWYSNQWTSQHLTVSSRMHLTTTGVHLNNASASTITSSYHGVNFSSTLVQFRDDATESHNASTQQSRAVYSF